MPEFSGSLSSVVEEVATYKQVAPEDLPSVTDAVPPKIITRLTAEWATQTDPIEFTYIWYHVTIAPDGEVTVTP